MEWQERIGEKEQVERNGEKESERNDSQEEKVVYSRLGG